MVRFIYTLLFCLCAVAPALARHLTLTPETLDDLDGATLQPGDRVLLSPGEGDLSLFTLTASGTAEQPILIYAKPGTVKLDGTFILENSRHIILQGLTIHGSSFAGTLYRLQRNNEALPMPPMQD